MGEIMSSLGGALGSVLTAIPGVVMAAGLLGFVYKRNAGLWEKLAAAYAAPWRESSEEKRYQHGALYGGGEASRSYGGFLAVALHDDGFAIRPMWIYSLFHQPLFIPYADVEGWRTLWYLNAKSIELTFARAPGLKLVMPKDQADWIAARASGRMQISDAPSPQKDRPRFWYWLVLVNATLALGALAYVGLRLACLVGC